MATRELRDYIKRKESQPQSADGFYMTPDIFDDLYNRTWECMVGYLSDGSLVHQQLMRILSQKQSEENLAYLPPEYQLPDTQSSMWREPSSYAGALFNPIIESAPVLTSREIRRFSDKIQDLAAEVGLESVAVTEPLRLSNGFIAQIVEVQKGEDSMPFPTMMVVPEHGYGRLRPNMLEVMRQIGNISYSLSHPTISFQLYDGGNGNMVQQQEFGSLDQFLLSMHHMYSTSTMRNDVRDSRIPLSQFVLDPEMVGIYGIHPLKKDQLKHELGPRWQVGLRLKEIYAQNSWDPKVYKWKILQQYSGLSIPVSEGTIPQSVRLGSLFPTREEITYKSRLFSIGELILGTSVDKVKNPLLETSECLLSDAIADMVIAWRPIIDMAHSEVLYSVLNSTWFTALSYGIAQRSRIHNSLSLPIQ